MNLSGLHNAEKAHKRIAALDLVNQQMKVYFRLNTIRLSAALVSAVEGTRAMPFESFPASARVTYKYYTGRIAVFDENFVRSPHRSAVLAHYVGAQDTSCIRKHGFGYRPACLTCCVVKLYRLVVQMLSEATLHCAGHSAYGLDRSLRQGSRAPRAPSCQHRRRRRRTCCMR